LENLATNALKYGKEGAQVLVRLNNQEGQVCLSVKNEGPSLTALEQRTIFEPFARTLSAKQSGHKGWGIGLTLVNNIAKAHGGDVSVESTEAIGTTFLVRLPIVPTDNQSVH
jgi:two-component system phosphate regulon sensor histidine kinase PhoR